MSFKKIWNLENKLFTIEFEIIVSFFKTLAPLRVKQGWMGYIMCKIAFLLKKPLQYGFQKKCHVSIHYYKNQCFKT